MNLAPEDPERPWGLRKKTYFRSDFYFEKRNFWL